jgi:hypothetical protein
MSASPSIRVSPASDKSARVRITVERWRVNLLPVIFVALAVVIFLRYPLGLLMLAVMLGFH